MFLTYSNTLYQKGENFNLIQYYYFGNISVDINNTGFQRINLCLRYAIRIKITYLN